MSVALAIFAHPDDIEFVAAGTLLLLKKAGWELHYCNLCRGNCGSQTTDGPTTAAIRQTEALTAATLLGATWHPPLTDDLELMYDVPTLRRVAALVREVQPRIVLTHALVDYMEDHMAASRLAVTSAFARGMPNFATSPATDTYSADVTVYHALPHGLRDPLGQPASASLYIDTTSVHSSKRGALAAHVSQKAWLDVSQGMDSYLAAMDEMSHAAATLARKALATLGQSDKTQSFPEKKSGKSAAQPDISHDPRPPSPPANESPWQFAEGWRRHLHLGFSATDDDPLAAALAEYALLVT
ncbi:MAG: PIG-L family deacetylase [Pirellulales bacterium]|nr:PIG-L family deacetylase [Pirellulales bacterium]